MERSTKKLALTAPWIAIWIDAKFLVRPALLTISSSIMRPFFGETGAARFCAKYLARPSLAGPALAQTKHPLTNSIGEPSLAQVAWCGVEFDPLRGRIYPVSHTP